MPHAFASRLLGVVAIIIGLLGMHALGAAPADAAPHHTASSAMPAPAASGHHLALPADLGALGGGGTIADPTCDADCMSGMAGMLGCAVLAIGCVALVALSVLALLGRRRVAPLTARTALRTVHEFVGGPPPAHLRPDLVALSISRT
ncbi:hypothetical protein SAMN05428970_0265 [Agromyces sp. CF514]|uniref:hypothetical protein n=1 Tax=Agromyces sp. CF514 TaxID=1881031 RepID=UPI0008E8AB16|nr:hypothetical protein [Agromyces sp. CF514]SFR67740.1 hypothetical protein SAMN05428970_0265 [Agromyces sp. CF514]